MNIKSIYFFIIISLIFISVAFPISRQEFNYQLDNLKKMLYISLNNPELKLPKECFYFPTFRNVSGPNGNIKFNLEWIQKALSEIKFELNRRKKKIFIKILISNLNGLQNEDKLMSDIVYPTKKELFKKLESLENMKYVGSDPNAVSSVYSDAIKGDIVSYKKSNSNSGFFRNGNGKTFGFNRSNYGNSNNSGSNYRGNRYGLSPNYGKSSGNNYGNNSGSNSRGNRYGSIQNSGKYSGNNYRKNSHNSSNFNTNGNYANSNSQNCGNSTNIKNNIKRVNVSGKLKSINNKSLKKFNKKHIKKQFKPKPKPKPKPKNPNKKTDYLKLFIKFLYWIVVVGIIIFFLFLIFAIYKSIRKQTSIKDYIKINSEKLPDERKIPEDLYSNALLRASENNYLEAIRLLTIGSLILLDEKNILRYDSSKTNGEYLSLLLKKSGLYNIFKGPIRVFDRIIYGYDEPNEKSFIIIKDMYNKLKRIEL